MAGRGNYILKYYKILRKKGRKEKGRVRKGRGEQRRGQKGVQE